MRLLIAALVIVAVVASSFALAADQKVVVGAADQSTVVNTSFKGSTLMGMAVKNAKDEKVGTINDLVIDTPSGHVKYAALSVGGFLGIGDKLFAVPWKSLTMKHDTTGSHFVLDIDKDRLKNAPGFDKDHWPEVGNSKFFNDVDKYYNTTTVETPRANVKVNVK